MGQIIRHPFFWVTVIFLASGVALMALSVLLMNRIKNVRPTASEFDMAAVWLVNDIVDGMRTEIDANEKAFVKKTESISDTAHLKIESHFSGNYFCFMGKDSFIDILSEPLYKAGRNNNFATVLTKEQFANYRAELFDKIMDGYTKKFNYSAKISCMLIEYVPKIEEIKEILDGVVDFWIGNILLEFTNLVKANREVCFAYKQKLHKDKQRSSQIDNRQERYKDILNSLEKRPIGRK